MVSGFPYITGSADIDKDEEDMIEFPRVTRSITVINRGAPDLRIHFVSEADDSTVISGYHYITLTEAKDSMTMNVKCKRIYISNPDANNGSYEVFAELTGINVTPTELNLTGSGITG